MNTVFCSINALGVEADNELLDLSDSNEIHNLRFPKCFSIDSHSKNLNVTGGHIGGNFMCPEEILCA